MTTANRTSFVVVLFGKDRLAFSGTFSCGFSFLYDILLLALTGLYLVAQSRIVGVAFWWTVSRLSLCLVGVSQRTSGRGYPCSVDAFPCVDSFLLYSTLLAVGHLRSLG